MLSFKSPPSDLAMFEADGDFDGLNYLSSRTVSGINTAARSLYKKLGYTESGIVPTTFNGIGGVMLVGLEKWIGGM